MKTKWFLYVLVMIGLFATKETTAAIKINHSLSFTGVVNLNSQYLLPFDFFPIRQMVKDTSGDKSIEVGDMLPEFIMPDLYGNVVNLSDFKGKYILLDFWSSWCKPCRMENPFLVHLYNQYKSPRFEIIGISIDTDRAQWFKAVKSDGLTWVHLSDLAGQTGKAANFIVNFWEGRKVVSIPQSYLVDPGGKVIAKNLRGEALEEMLKKILTSK